MKKYSYLDIPRPYWTNASTPEEIYNDLLSFATAFINIDSRFTILEDISGLRGSYGGIVYIGFNGENIPIMAFCNPYNYSSYYYHGFALTLVDQNMYPRCGESFSSFGSYMNGYMAWECNSTSYKNTKIRVWYRSFGEILSFDIGLYASTQNTSNLARWFIAKLTSLTETKEYYFNLYQLYNSYCYYSIMGAPTSANSFNLLANATKITGRYYMLEVGLELTTYKLKDIFYFSGTQVTTNPCSFIFNGVEYQTLGQQYSNCWTLCVKATE